MPLVSKFWSSWSLCYNALPHKDLQQGCVVLPHRLQHLHLSPNFYFCQLFEPGDDIDNSDNLDNSNDFDCNNLWMMSDWLPNPYSNFRNNFPQGLPPQQSQHRPPQQLMALGTQPTLTGIRNSKDTRVWQQMQQQRLQQQHSGGESIHVTTPQQQQQVHQVCLATIFLSSLLPLSWSSEAVVYPFLACDSLLH